MWSARNRLWKDICQTMWKSSFDGWLLWKHAYTCNEKYVNFSSFSFHAVTSAPASSSTSFRSCRPCSRQKKLLCKKLRPHSVGHKKTNRRSRLVYVSLNQSWNIDQTYSLNDTTVYLCHVLCSQGSHIDWFGRPNWAKARRDERPVVRTQAVCGMLAQTFKIWWA